MAKSIIDIEDLLIWAYRFKAIDKVAADALRGDATSTSPHLGSGGVWHVINQVATVGAYIPSTGGSGDLPDNDALIVHDAVLALPEAWIEWLSADEVAPEAWTASSLLEDGATIVRCAPGQWIQHADGVRNPVERIEPAITVMVHARSGIRPEIYPEWRRAVGRRCRSGDNLAIGRGDIDEAAVMYARALYLTWHAALAEFAEALSGRLERWSVSPPRAGQTPWLTRRSPKPPVSGINYSVANAL